MFFGVFRFPVGNNRNFEIKKRAHKSKTPSRRYQKKNDKVQFMTGVEFVNIYELFQTFEILTFVHVFVSIFVREGSLSVPLVNVFSVVGND